MPKKEMTTIGPQHHRKISGGGMPQGYTEQHDNPGPGAYDPLEDQERTDDLKKCYI